MMNRRNRTLTGFCLVVVGCTVGGPSVSGQRDPASGTNQPEQRSGADVLADFRAAKDGGKQAKLMGFDNTNIELRCPSPTTPCSIVNKSGSAISIDGYSLTGPTGSFNATSWHSIDDAVAKGESTASLGDGAQYFKEVKNPTSSTLAELNAPASGVWPSLGSWSIGYPLDTSMTTTKFTYTKPNGEIWDAPIIGTFVPGDWNQDGRRTVEDEAECSTALTNATTLAAYRTLRFPGAANDAKFLAMGDISGDGLIVVGTPNLDCMTLKDLNAGKQRRVTSLAASSSNSAWHHCAMWSDNIVKCWGRNSYGAHGTDSFNVLGIGDQPNEMGSFLQAVKGGEGGYSLSAKAVANGAYHTCAIIDRPGDPTDQQIKCWGANQQGQLGVGDLINRGDSTAAGHTMATLPVIDLGTIAPGCPGNGPVGVACADGNGDGIVNAADEAIQAANFGRTYTYCGGPGDFNLDGTVNFADWELAHTQSLSGTTCTVAQHTAKTVTANAIHTCAILDDDTVKCWGIAAQLGLNDGDHGGAPGTMGNSLRPLNLGNPSSGLGSANTTRVTALSAGWRHTCAILSHPGFADDKQIKCWGLSSGFGWGFLGSLGYGDAVDRLVPEPVATVNLGAGHSAKSVVAGDMHTCAILDDDTVKCWGLNNRGQLGYDDTLDRGTTPASMTSLGPVHLGAGRTALSVKANYTSTCALLDNHQVKCWGMGGGIGLGDETNRGDSSAAGHSMLTFNHVDLGTGRYAKAIDSSNTSTCALLDNDRVKCWGSNVFGEAGLGNTLDHGRTPGTMGDNLPSADLNRYVSTLAGDANGDCVVNIFDINMVSAHWGESGPAGDVNHDGTVNIFDINLISANWGMATSGLSCLY